jgi:PAS domain S-box-containing protein
MRPPDQSGEAAPASPGRASDDAEGAHDGRSAPPHASPDLAEVRARQQAVVADLGVRALEGLSATALLQEAAERVATVLGTELVKVVELESDGESARLVAGVGWRPGVVGHARIGVGRDSQAGYALLTHAPVVVDDLRTESRLTHPPLLLEQGVVSGISVILYGPERRAYGVLGAHTSQRRRFTPNDVNFLQGVANVLSAALHREHVERALRDAHAEAEATNAALEQANQQLEEQGVEFELANQQLQDQTSELEAQTEELQATTAELEERTDEAQRARAAAEYAAESTRRLQAVTARLNEATSDDQVLDVIFESGLEALGADAGSLALVHGDPGDPSGAPREFEMVRSRGYGDEVAARYQRFPVTPGRPLSECVLHREAMFVETADDWYVQWPRVSENLSALGFQAFAAVPVQAGDRLLAALSLSFRGPRAFDEVTRTFLGTLAEQCALALERQRHHATALRRAEREAAILATIEDVFIAYDRELRYQSVNPPAAALLGRTAAELLGRRVEDVFPAFAGTPVHRALRRTLDTGERAGVENYLSVSRRWLDVRTYPSPDGVVLVARDVTARRRAEDRASFLAEASRLLAESLDYEATLRAVAEASVPRLADWCAVDMLAEPRPLGAAEPWPPNVRRLAVVHQDPAKVEWAHEIQRRMPPDWSQPTGLTRVLREGVTEFYPEIPDELLTAAARTSEELALLREIGFRAAVVVPLVARGLTLGALTLVMADSGRHYDESDRELAEELAHRAATAVDNARLYRDAERARAEAEAASGAKSQFLATMSHELRTPLNAIQGHVQLVELGVHGPVTDAQRGALDRAQRAQQHLLGLINDVLLYARIEGGRVEYDLRAVSPAAVIADVLPMIEPQLATKGIRLEVRVPPDAPPVWADHERLTQILLNLLSNAAKFTNAGGRVTVELLARADETRSDDPRDAGYAFLRVSDTGIGIPREKLEAVFEPFVQVRQAYRPAQGGTGLGLAISRDLARGMGGELRARSVPGQGSAFTVTLRRAVAPSGEPTDRRIDHDRRVEEERRTTVRRAEGHENGREDDRGV